MPHGNYTYLQVAAWQVLLWWYRRELSGKGGELESSKEHIIKIICRSDKCGDGNKAR